MNHSLSQEAADNMIRAKGLGKTAMRFYAPETKKGATWPKSFLVNRVILQTDFSSGIPCSLENFQKDDTLLGRGAVVVHLEGESASEFLTFSYTFRMLF
jgi:hypothetical protein